MNRINALIVIGLCVSTTASAASNTAADPQPAIAAAAPAPAEKLICHSEPEIGSLVRTRKQCFTRRQWDRISESQRTGARRLQEGLSGGYRCTTDC